MGYGNKNRPFVQVDNEEIKEQLAQTVKQTADKTFYNNLSIHKKPKPSITILDDDTRNELYSVIYPIIQELNVPISSAAITGRIGSDPYTITTDQYKEMGASGLVEYISHTVSHQDLTTLTLEEVEAELAESRKWLIENGGNPDYFVPPFGQDNEDIRELIKKYYKGSFLTYSTGYVLKPPLNTYQIRRSDFETDLTTQKQRLDEAMAGNGWIILNTHSQYPSFTESDFREIITYAKSIGLDFITIGEGMQRFGNLLELDSYSQTNENYGIIDAIGNRHGVLDNRFFVVDATNVKIDTPPSYYKFKDGVTAFNIGNNIYDEYGWPSSGVLIVYKLHELSTKQIFMPNDSNTILKRDWLGSSWGNFQNLNGDKQTLTVDFGSVPSMGVVEKEVLISGITRFNNIIVNSRSYLPPNIFINYYVVADGKLRIKMFNSGETAETLDSHVFNLRIFI